MTNLLNMASSRKTSPSPRRRPDNLELQDSSADFVTATTRTTIKHKNSKSNDFVSRNKKIIIASVSLLVVLGILFLVLGLTGVFDGTQNPTTTTVPADNTAANSTSTETSVSPSHPPPTIPVLPGERIECLPDRKNVTLKQCYDAGCSYGEVSLSDGWAPNCYVNRDIAGYKLIELAADNQNQTLFDLTSIHGKGLYSVPFVRPQLVVNKKTRSTLQFKVNTVHFARRLC